MSGRLRKSTGGALSRPQATLRETRSSPFRPSHNAQSGHDLFTEHATPSRKKHDERADSLLRAPSHDSSKENLTPIDAETYEAQRKCIEELRAELATMQYRIETTEQEKEMLVLQHENEVRDIQRKAEDDFKQKQFADSERSRAQRQYESMQEELQNLKTSAANDTAELEKRLRDTLTEAQTLKEQLEDLSVEKDEAERQNQRRAHEMEAQLLDLQQIVEELESGTESREASLTTAQQQLAEKDELVGNLEAEIIRLKAQTGDAETVAIIRRELSDQVQHIRTLEARTTKQHTELVHLRQVHKTIEIIEEEKRSLQRKVDAAQAIEAELNECRIQKQRLENERLAWTAYLESASAENGVMEFDSPEAVARALVEERYNSASLIEKLGEIQPQIAERDEIIKSLESDKKRLTSDLEKSKTAGPAIPASKAQARLERQRALATKEVEYLRAQLKTFDTEDETFDTGKFDQQKADRIAELEKLVDTYKEEVQNLHKELSTAESSTGTPDPAVGSKRSREDEFENEQLGELNRKRRKLADDLSKLQAAHQLLQKENDVLQSRLTAAEAANQTRILSLRSNPTADFEAIKAATLAALKLENQELLAQLSKEARRNPNTALIPASQLAAAQREIEEAQRETTSAKKTAKRLKEVWAAKSQEFKEAIFSTLGWTVTFIPNGKMRVESLFYPSTTDEHENSIVFDGERGTMKVSGGPQSPFARKIGDQIQFWVREKGCIPGFLAALTLEFYEEHTRNAAQ